MKIKSSISFFVIAIILLLSSCFNVDENSEEYKKTKADLEKEPYFSKPKEDSETVTIDSSKLIGKWIYVQTRNTETGLITPEKPNYKRPDEYKKNGIRTYYDLKGNRLTEKYSISKNILTLNPNNPKETSEWKILELNENIFEFCSVEKNTSFLISKFERAPDDENQEINTTNVFGTWNQYKFINKSNNTTIDGPVTWTDGNDAVYIFKENGEYVNGSIKNNSIEGK